MAQLVTKVTVVAQLVAQVTMVSLLVTQVTVVDHLIIQVILGVQLVTELAVRAQCVSGGPPGWLVESAPSVMDGPSRLPCRTVRYRTVFPGSSCPAAS